MDFRFTDEQKAFKEQVLKFSQKELAPLAEEADWRGEFCWDAWKKMGAFGLLGLTYPEEYGGSGADVVTACLAGEAVAQGGAEGGLCLSWGAHTYLCGDTILTHGTEEQKNMFPKLLPENGWVQWVLPNRALAPTRLRFAPRPQEKEIPIFSMGQRCLLPMGRSPTFW